MITDQVFFISNQKSGFLRKRDVTKANTHFKENASKINKFI